jgi:hypothetical protein
MLLSVLKGFPPKEVITSDSESIGNIFQSGDVIIIEYLPAPKQDNSLSDIQKIKPEEGVLNSDVKNSLSNQDQNTKHEVFNPQKHKPKPKTTGSNKIHKRVIELSNVS